MFNLPILLAQESAIQQDPFANSFFGLGADERFVVMLVAIGCGTAVIIAVTAIVAGVYTSVVRRQAETELKHEMTELKQDMLDRGMSAEEIREVIEATPPKDFADRWVKARMCDKKR